jgi:acyl carrier protein
LDATRDKILEQVTEVLVDALGVDEDEVLPNATLMADLGAESIDFLDIVFRLEKAFDIKIDREELFPAETLLNDPALVHDNVLTDEGLALLKEKMGHSDLTMFAKDPNVNRLGDLFTVKAVVNFIEARIK